MSAVEVLRDELRFLEEYTDESTGKGIDHDYCVKIRDALWEAVLALEKKEDDRKQGVIQGLEKVKAIITDWDYSPDETGEEALDLLYELIDKRLGELGVEEK